MTSITRKKVFLSFPRAAKGGIGSCTPMEEAYVHRVSYFLRKQRDLDVFCFDIEGDDAGELWTVHVRPHLSKDQVFVLFIGPELRVGSGQVLEYRAWKDISGNRDVAPLIVKLRHEAGISKLLGLPNELAPIFTVNGKGGLTLDDLDSAEKCAESIYRSIYNNEQSPWLDGLPIGYPFGYEKQIIDAFAAEGTIRVLARKAPASGGIPPGLISCKHLSIV